MSSRCRAPTVLLPQQAGQIEQQYDTRIIDLASALRAQTKGFARSRAGLQDGS